jgi:hypothetical protein
MFSRISLDEQLFNRNARAQEIEPGEKQLRIRGDTLENRIGQRQPRVRVSVPASLP